MIKAIIVDDESKSRENLQILIEEFCDGVEVKGLAGTVAEAKKLIGQHKPDVVFLDIQMKKETGFDLLETIPNIDFEVVFITAYSDYALKAIKFSAVDYILKPVDIEELQKAIKKITIRVKEKSFAPEKIELLLQNLKPQTSSSYKIAVPSSNGLSFIKLNEIIFCEGQNNYTTIYTTAGKSYVVSKTLKEYEDMLVDHNFYRIHKSHLINLNEIKEYVRGDGGYVVMNNNKSLDVSKRRKDAFLTRISQIN